MSQSLPHLSVVIPVFNEELNLPALFTRLELSLCEGSQFLQEPIAQ